MLPITLTMAAAAALINVWLAARIVPLRYSQKVEHGDGGSKTLMIRIRSHANFTEYTPFVLILVALIEFSQGSQRWLWGVGIVYLIGRLLHPFGMERRSPNPLRAGGMLVTWGVLVGLALYAIYLVYTTPLPAHV